MIIIGRKRCTGGGPRPGILLWVAVTLALGLLGVGFAAWQDGLTIRGTTATGNIDPAFTDCWVAGESVSPSQADVFVTDEGKRLVILIADAHPGYHADFGYLLTNRGSVPVRFETAWEASAPGLAVTNNLPYGVLEPDGGTAEGGLSVTVGDVEEESQYNFSLTLIFRQWNL